MLRATSLFTIVFLLFGCSGSTVKPAEPNMTSNPAGASVYANGALLGETPLSKDLYKVFPAAWKNLVYQATGVLMFKLEGCEDHIIEVNDYVLSQPIHAQLTCTKTVENRQKPLGSTEKQNVEKNKLAPETKMNTSVEDRLRKAKNLHEQGLIDDNDYQRLKMRILQEL